MILLDTHVVLWLGKNPQLLSNRAAEIIAAERRSEGLAIANKTLWEVAHLIATGRVQLHATMRTVLTRIEKSFVVYPITSAVAEASVQFSSRFPRDPADRLIAATALANSLTLVTADRAIRESGEVPCIW